MNLKHLFYFWKVAHHGGVIRAAEAIHMTPQTLSGQIKLLEDSLGIALFEREGRSMVLTDAGRLAMQYADELFALGAELEQVLKHYPKDQVTDFRVGVADIVPKNLVYQLLKPAMAIGDSVRLVCREGPLTTLLTDLATHKLDLVISDEPLPVRVEVNAYSHPLIESGISFIAHDKLLADNEMHFPHILGDLPIFMPSEHATLGRKLREWFDQQHIRPNIIGVFDDTALMNAFGQEGGGVFPIHSVMEKEYLQMPSMRLLGRTNFNLTYFALSVERKIRHPCVLAMTSHLNAVT